MVAFTFSLNFPFCFVIYLFTCFTCFMYIIISELFPLYIFLFTKFTFLIIDISVHQIDYIDVAPHAALCTYA